MNTKNTYKVGDILVDSDQIYKIYEIKSGLVHYRPIARSDRHESLTCTIPEENIFKAGMRRPLTADQIDEFLSQLKKEDTTDKLIDYKLVKETLFLNDPTKTAPLLRLLWNNKGKGDVYSRTDEDMLSAIMKHLIEEVALVLKITPEKAKQKIEKMGKKIKTT